MTLKLVPIKPATFRPWKAPVRHNLDASEFWLDDELCTFIRHLNELWGQGGIDRERSFLIRIMVFTGVRIHEACWIELQHCHERTIHLVETKADKYGVMKPRDIEWFPEFKPFYDEFLAMRRAEGGTWLFPAKRQRITKTRRMEDRPFSVDLAHKWWNACLAGSGVRPHD